ncbi:cysteine--tRNA ligase [Vampirovibrio sp.]|uniref:cysteine--tRNA ligase n=1 Tax=Vampirovibrio sp. TaxID=2717857 RepID=UPI0035948308
MAESSSPGLQLFNTLTGTLEPFIPLDPAGKQVKLYVCGPTVYDDAHLGHARCYITWDVLYRFLKFSGYGVKYVRNVTDVDDKILNRATERGETPAELAERNYQSFSDDMKALNVLPPDEEPRATHYISHMLAGVQTLVAKGAAYPTADGSVYFRVSAKADYGKLKFGTQNPEALKKHLDDLKSGARVEVDAGKESPLDFALWKAVSPSDPNGWESPWPAEGQAAAKGWGRPGWHMECSAMNQAVFGDQIDIHAGGADLIFPHHENEIAQSEAWSGLSGHDEHSRFAKYWLHNGFVNVSGEKMSKSLGNFSTVKKLLERYDANTIRYFLLTNHYRMPVDFNDEALQACKEWIVRVRRKFVQLNVNLLDILNGVDSKAKQAFLGGEFCLALQRDLNTSQALGELNRALKGFSEESLNDETLLQNTALMMFLMGFDLAYFGAQLVGTTGPLQAFGSMNAEGAVVDSPAKLLADQVRQRRAAKAEKNWAEADRLRNEIMEQGYQLLDNKDGTTTVEKDGLEIVRV